MVQVMRGELGLRLGRRIIGGLLATELAAQAVQSIWEAAKLDLNVAPMVQASAQMTLEMEW